MAPSHHIRHTADLIREQVHTETDPFSLTLSTRQNDNSKDPDRSGRDRGSSRSGKGDDSKGARNDKDGSRGDRSNRSGGGRGSSGGRRSGDNDKNGDSSNNSRNRGGRRTDNDSASRNKAPAASSGAPAPATTMQSSLGTPRPLPAIASPLPKVEGVNPVNNAVPASGGQAGRAPPAAVNTPFIMMPNSNPSPVILLSTVIPVCTTYNHFDSQFQHLTNLSCIGSCQNRSANNIIAFRPGLGNWHSRYARHNTKPGTFERYQPGGRHQGRLFQQSEPRHPIF